MKRFVIIGASLALVACQQAEQTEVRSETDLSAETEVAEQAPSEIDSVSYFLGFDYGERLAQMGMALDAESFAAGARAAAAGEATELSEEELETARAEFRERQQQLAQQRLSEQREQQAEAAATNLAEGQAFLEENAQREGITQTDSGLQYEVLEAGDGEKPDAGDTVTVHYKGTLIDGTVFDSSYDRGEPVTFALGQVIPGWQEALPLMSPGAKYKFYIPADLAYGERSVGRIGPNSALIFEVELLEVGERDEQEAAES